MHDISLKVTQPFFGGYSAIVTVDDKEYKYYSFVMMISITKVIAKIPDMELRQLVWECLYDVIQAYKAKNDYEQIVQEW